MSDHNPLIKIEHFATAKQFFTVYPNIFEELLVKGKNPIQVFTWYIDNIILLDVFIYSGENQAGYIFHKNVPIIENVDMNLSIVGKNSHIVDLIKFQCCRDAAFGIYTKFVSKDSIDDQVSVIFNIFDDSTPQFLRNIYITQLTNLAK